MKCASCGEIMEGDPMWVDGEAYCSEECAEAGPIMGEHDEDYGDYEKQYREEYEEEPSAE